MSKSAVLVFGATGAVGSAAAQEAAARGSKVWLAMRDPNKTLSWLSKTQEADGTYTRVKADLSDPSSLTEAVRKSGATSAFVYVLVGARVDMRPSIQALKDAGITWISLLSSSSVKGDVRTIPKHDFIPYEHAQVEIAIEEVGIAFASVRPGFFASNIFMWWTPQIKTKNEVALLYPEIKYDFIVPENIGQVAGALLTQPKPHLNPSTPETVYVFGPKLISQEDAVKLMAKVSGKDIAIKSVETQGFIEAMKAIGLDEKFATYFADSFKKQKDEFYAAGYYDESQGTIQKYADKKPISFEEYLQSVKSQF